VGVTGLEPADPRAVDVDQTMDAIAGRYGERLITRGLAIRKKS
jgi:hypothetical protein